MTVISLRIVDGPERGKVLNNVNLPATIGREKGNSIVIDDERISRTHLKIFEESGLILLVDLDSTNGTRINGETSMIWALRPGDLISIGNTFIVYGTKQQIAGRLADIRKGLPEGNARFMGLTAAESHQASIPAELPATSEHSLAHTSAVLLQNELFDKLRQEDIILLRALFPPKLPTDMTMAQISQLSKFLFYLCLRFRTIIDDVRAVESSEVDMRDFGKKDKTSEALLHKKYDKKDSRITMAPNQWQNLMDLYEMISWYLGQLNESGDVVSDEGADEKD